MKAKGIICTLAAAILLVVVVRVFFLMLAVIVGDGMEPVFLEGDRVAVNRWAYGLRSPFIQFTGYKRFHPLLPKHGDWVAFNAPDTTVSLRPDTGEVCMGCLVALPGDTVWMGPHGKISSFPDFSVGRVWPVVVPGKEQEIRIRPWNAELYALTIRRFEGENEVCVRGDSLYVRGKRVETFDFQHDFYWMSSGNEQNIADSRTMGFIPECNVIGRMQMILYSLDGWSPRWERFFKSVP